MLTGEKHRADSDPRSQDLRERHFHSRLWHCCFGRGGGWYHGWLRRRSREDSRDLSVEPRRQQLFHFGHAEYHYGLHRRGDGKRPNRQRKWIARSSPLRIFTIIA